MKVTVPPHLHPSLRPHTQARASLGLGQHSAAPNRCQLWQQGGLGGAVTTWSPGTPLSSLGRGTWYRAVGRSSWVPARTGNWAMRIFNQALGNRPGLWRLVRDSSSLDHLGAWAPRQSGGAGHLPGRKGRDISGCPEKPLCISGRGSSSFNISRTWAVPS